MLIHLKLGFWFQVMIRIQVTRNKSLRYALTLSVEFIPNFLNNQSGYMKRYVVHSLLETEYSEWYNSLFMFWYIQILSSLVRVLSTMVVNGWRCYNPRFIIISNFNIIFEICEILSKPRIISDSTNTVINSFMLTIHMKKKFGAALINQDLSEPWKLHIYYILSQEENTLKNQIQFKL